MGSDGQNSLFSSRQDGAREKSFSAGQGKGKNMRGGAGQEKLLRLVWFGWTSTIEVLVVSPKLDQVYLV